MCCGSLPGATSMTSKRMSRSLSSGWGEPQLRGGDDAALASFGHRFRSLLGAVARLDLDEDEGTSTTRDNVDLAERSLPAPRGHPVALGDQKHGSAAFR